MFDINAPYTSAKSAREGAEQALQEEIKAVYTKIKEAARRGSITVDVPVIPAFRDNDILFAHLRHRGYKLGYQYGGVSAGKTQVYAISIYW